MYEYQFLSFYGKNESKLLISNPNFFIKSYFLQIVSLIYDVDAIILYQVSMVDFS